MPGDDEPEPAVAEEVLRGADEQHRPRRQHGRERAGEEADAVAEVLGDAERGHLALVVAQRGLDDRRDAAEEVPDAGHGLQPHCGDEHQPPVRGEGPQPVPIGLATESPASKRWDFGAGISGSGFDPRA